MKTIEDYAEVARKAVRDTAQDFHFRVLTDDGQSIEVPFGYQIEELGFRPYRAGKASPDELRTEFDRIIREADAQGISIGIENPDSVRKFSIQMGLGVDCSNFAYRALSLVHDRMGLTTYPRTVFRPAADIRALHATKKPSWDAKDENGGVRALTVAEKETLETTNLLDIEWIAEVFGKDPEFVLGSAHICDNNATDVMQAVQTLPGDLVAFTKAGSEVVSHVGVIEQVEVEVDGRSVRVNFWHSWHTRDFTSGLRQDNVTIGPDSTMLWSHKGLKDPFRYQDCSFRRPAAMAIAYAALTSTVSS